MTFSNARLIAAGAAALIAVMLGAGLRAQMPDARSMSGIPRVVDDLPAGTVSVRVVRGDLASAVANLPVELRTAGTIQTVQTDETGRAEFKAIPAGVTVRAAATLDGERLESEEFTIPPAGGVRLLLSGPPPGGATARTGTSSAGAVPAAPGAVVFGGDSRIVVQFAEDELEVFYLLDLVNAGGAPVQSEPLILEMPAFAQGTAALEGSSPQAVVDGRRVTISGPFRPGRTPVLVAYTIAPGSDRVRIAQRLPAALTQVTLVVQKAGAVTLLSPSIQEQREMSDQGRTFLLGSGRGLAAGETVVVDLAGLPHAPRWPVVIALALAALVLAAGAWAAVRPGEEGATAARARVEARREHLLAELEKLDGQFRSGKFDSRRHAARREDLLTELERIYGTLDSGGAAGERAMRLGA